MNSSVVTWKTALWTSWTVQQFRCVNDSIVNIASATPCEWSHCEHLKCITVDSSAAHYVNDSIAKELMWMAALWICERLNEQSVSLAMWTTVLRTEQFKTPTLWARAFLTAGPYSEMTSQSVQTVRWPHSRSIQWDDTTAGPYSERTCQPVQQWDDVSRSIIETKCQPVLFLRWHVNRSRPYSEMTCQPVQTVRWHVTRSIQWDDL